LPSNPSSCPWSTTVSAIAGSPRSSRMPSGLSPTPAEPPGVSQPGSPLIGHRRPWPCPHRVRQVIQCPKLRPSLGFSAGSVVICRWSIDERLHKPCVAAVLGNVLELGNYPVSSSSVRLHHIAIDLRKHPVGRRPVPSFPAPRAIPKPQVAGSIPAVGAGLLPKGIGDRGARRPSSRVRRKRSHLS
jgi:hypothetical protein